LAPSRTSRIIAAISILAGVVAATAGSHPTGNSTIDLVLVGVVVAGVTWLGAAAMRWDAAMATLVAGVLSWSIIGAIVGGVAAIVGFTANVKPGRRSVVNAALIAIALNLAARSRLDVFLGASALMFVVLAGYLGAVGFVRRPRGSRQVVAIVVGTAAAAAAVSTFFFVVFASLAADDLRAANDHATDGLEALGDGDIDVARESFDEAAVAFEAADERLDTPLTGLARYVPGVAQHHRVATELISGAAESSRLLSNELARIDLDTLSVSGGRIDVDQVRSLQTSLLAIELQIEALQTTVSNLDSQWLAPPVADRLDDLSAELAEQRQRSSDALTVAIAAPGLLGGDEPRTYFIGFTTPAEARGIGGFMGNWAEITVTDGQIAVTRFGRTDDLNTAGDPATRRFTTSATATADATGTTDGVTATEDATGTFDPQLDEWLARYGSYNLASGPGGTTGPEPWKNMNMSPDMAVTGRAIADLYPQSGGSELDGVFMMDVYTLARFLEFTGPIPLPDGQVIDGQRTVTADTAADFLLNDQYDLTTTLERVDVLEEFSLAVIDTLLAGTLPPPTDLRDTLGPMVDQGRFAGWAARPGEQTVLEQVGLAGTLADPDLTGDALAITFNNAAGNKIDYYLDARAAYAVTADAATSTATATLDLTLTNNAPTNGEPNYVIGNLIGLDDGHNRTWVSIFSKLPVTNVTLNGLPVDTEIGVEAGYFVMSAFVALAPGETSSLQFEMTGRLDIADGYTLAARTPPTVSPTPLTIDAAWLDAEGIEHRTTVIERDPGAATLSVTADR
jgi:hypothetical protein